MKKAADHFSCAQCPSRSRSVFHDFPDEAQPGLEAGKSCFVYKRGEAIFHEGHTPQGVYCIKEGKVKIAREGFEGKEQIIRFAKDGDVVGYRSLLSGERYASSAVALEETSVCFIPRSQLLQMVTSQPCLSLNFIKQACTELGDAGRLITNLAQKSVRERMAEILLMLRETFGETAEGAIDVKLSREELANLVGTATESAIRVLSDFQQEGLLELKGKAIHLKDRPKLLKTGKIA
jgi:CRP/FNR family transcriptional regulator, polysaccharide utilization system transcription regulator